MEQTTRIPTKDEIIVRQSQMQRAIEIFALTDRQPSIQEICRLSKVLTEFIFSWDEKAEPLKNFDKYTGNELKKDLVTDLTKVK